MDPTAEKNFIERSKGGDWKAFELLMGEYQEQVYRLAFRLSGTHEGADQITQDVFVKAHQGMNKFEGRARFMTWLHAITVRTVQDRQRRSRSGPTVVSLTEKSEVAHDGRRLASDDPADSVGREEFMEQIEMAIAKLPTEQRMAMTLVAMERLSYREAALAMECSEGALAWRVWDGRRRLREMLDGYLQI